MHRSVRFVAYQFQIITKFLVAVAAFEIQLKQDVSGDERTEL